MIVILFVQVSFLFFSCHFFARNFLFHWAMAGSGLGIPKIALETKREKRTGLGGSSVRTHHLTRGRTAGCRSVLCGPHGPWPHAWPGAVEWPAPVVLYASSMNAASSSDLHQSTVGQRAEPSGMARAGPWGPGARAGLGFCWAGLSSFALFVSSLAWCLLIRANLAKSNHAMRESNRWTELRKAGDLKSFRWIVASTVMTLRTDYYYFHQYFNTL